MQFYGFYILFDMVCKRGNAGSTFNDIEIMRFWNHKYLLFTRLKNIFVWIEINRSLTAEYIDHDLRDKHVEIQMVDLFIYCARTRASGTYLHLKICLKK